MRAPPALALDVALFLDLDGTLAPIEARPGDVVFERERTVLLRRLERALGGALAVISGRSLDDMDRILGGAPRAAGAVHGLVRRRPNGEVIEASPSADLARARREMEALVEAWPGLILEDKSISLALHFRQAPAAAPSVERAMARILSNTTLTRQDGSMVCELRTPGPDKRDALETFMREAPFAGRRPVMVGDDLTDEPAFEAAAAAGGFGVSVGGRPGSCAQYGLENVEAVRAWLAAPLATVAA
jgi:trehalose 6-phosphate phosphatase